MTGTECDATGSATALPTVLDYRTLADEVAREMRDCASRIRRFQQASVLDIGRELMAAKALVEHGFFRDWVKVACQLHIRTAERLMQTALLVGKNDKLSYLPPDGLLALASRSAPPAVVNEITEEITAGERLNAAQIKRRIAQAKQAEKRASEQRGEDGIEGHGLYQEHPATNALVAMLLAWDRFDEFMALLGEADLSAVAQVLADHHSSPPVTSMPEGELTSPAFSDRSLSPADSPPRDCSETSVEAPPAAPQKRASNSVTRDVESAIETAPPKVTAFEASNEVSAEELTSIWESLKRNTQWYGRQWVAEGCTLTSHPRENPAITESLLPFRAAASRASNRELQRFLDITAAQAA